MLPYPERRSDGLDAVIFGDFASRSPLEEIGLEILLDLIMFVLEAFATFL